MQFKVPQFIDIEDKLFGPFTFKQFVYLVGGAGIIFVIYKALPLWIGIFLIIPVGTLAGLLAFYKVNNRPFINYLQSMISYLFSSRLYIWKQRLAKPGEEANSLTTSVKHSSISQNSENKIGNALYNLNVNNGVLEK